MNVNQLYLCAIFVIVITIAIMFFRCEHYDKLQPQGINFYAISYTGNAGTLDGHSQPFKVFKKLLGTINNGIFTINMNNTPQFKNLGKLSLSLWCFEIQNNTSKIITSVTVSGTFLDMPDSHVGFLLTGTDSKSKYKSKSNFTRQIFLRQGKSMVFEVAGENTDSSLSFKFT